VSKKSKQRKGGRAQQAAPLQTFAEPSKQQLLSEIGISGDTFEDTGLTVDPWNDQLDGQEWFEKVDEMRRACGPVQAVEFGITLPVADTEWSVEAESDELREFVEYALFEAPSTPWPDVIRRAALSSLYGTWVFEIVLKEDDGRLVPRRFADRLPRSIAGYNFGPENDLVSITQKGQNADGDEIEVEIPTEKLLLFPYRLEGQNWNGLSAIRFAWSHYYFQKFLYQVSAIGAERGISGVPYVGLPANTNDADKATAKALARAIRRHEAAGFVLPFGYTNNHTSMVAGGAARPDQASPHRDQPRLPARLHLPRRRRRRQPGAGRPEDPLREHGLELPGDQPRRGGQPAPDPAVDAAQLPVDEAAGHAEGGAVDGRSGDDPGADVGVPGQRDQRRPGDPRCGGPGRKLLRGIMGLPLRTDEELAATRGEDGGRGGDRRRARLAAPKPPAGTGALQAAPRQTMSAPREQTMTFAAADVDQAVARVAGDMAAAEDAWQRQGRVHLIGWLQSLLSQLDALGGPSTGSGQALSRVGEVIVPAGLVDAYADWIAEWLTAAWEAAAATMAAEVGAGLVPATGRPQGPPVQRLQAKAAMIAQHHAEAARFEVVMAALRGETGEAIGAAFAEAMSSRLRGELPVAGREIAEAVS